MTARSVQWLGGAKLPEIDGASSAVVGRRWSRGASCRRGVLLLVVLSLLVLFILIAVTFVLIAGQYRRSSRAAGRAEQYGDDPQKQLDEIFGQVVRDTMLNGNQTNIQPLVSSALYGHSLLNDLYGNDGMCGKINGANVVTPLAAGAPHTQFVDLSAGSLSYFLLPTFVLPTSPYTLSGYFNGCVLTMIDGPAAELSTRIVGWVSTGTTATIRVVMFEGLDPSRYTSTFTGNFIINGRPFNGTGFGFNSAASQTDPTLLDAQDSNGRYLALLPNGRFFAGNLTYGPFGGTGGGDEDYDAPDVQNMLLAYSPADPTTAGAIGPGNPSPIIPSLHRPDLVNYYLSQPGNNLPSLANDGTLRKFLLRPVGPMQTTVNGTVQTVSGTMPGLDHPNFTGGNPGNANSAGMFDPINGPWDVDNDGDGFADSVWVDYGAPVQTAPDGRRFKPLAAILCLDLDGRLNVNAHGNIAHVETAGSNPVATVSTTPVQGNQNGSSAPYYWFAGNPSSTSGSAGLNRIRGQGYGPPEINLAMLFNNRVNGKNYSLSGSYASLLAARYAEPNSSLGGNSFNAWMTYPPYIPPSSASPYPAYANTNNATSPYPGITNFDDPLSALKQTDFAPLPLAAAYAAPSSFVSPDDLCGRGFIALDVRGMPLTPLMGIPYSRQDDPYELNLNRANVRSATSPAASRPAIPAASAGTTPDPADSPFTAAELERILRIYDIDAAALPDRLRAIVDPSDNALAYARNVLTTDSFDLPSPAILPTRDIWQNLPNWAIPQQIADLLVSRLAGASPPVANIDFELQKMLSPELMAGLRMDLNRPFGNGADDNGNRVVDEPGETEAFAFNSNTNVPFSPNYPDLSANPAPLLTNGMATNPNSPATYNASDPLLARHMYARHLYVLMMLLIDSGAILPTDGEGDVTVGTATQSETARAVAQWAVNVVDFRDADSIMTPFEYDVNPFNGWSIDGLLGTADDTNDERGLVWGCERPELLITETLAWHDLRQEDLLFDSFGANHASNSFPNPDSTPDQRLFPQGCFFVELYNPWVTQNSIVARTGCPMASETSGEFYAPSSSGSTGVVGINLAQTAPPGVAGGSPVWRLVITTAAVDLDDPLPVNQANAQASIERSIYFQTVAPGQPNDGTEFYTTQPVAPILPGRYGVIGSGALQGKVNGVTGYVNIVGRIQDKVMDVLHTPHSSGDGINAKTANTRAILLAPNANPDAPNQVLIQNNNWLGPGGVALEPNTLVNPAPPSVAGMQNPIAIVIDKPQSISVSEPVAGWAAYAASNGWRTTSPTSPTQELVLNPPQDNWSDPFGLSVGYNGQWRWVHLQRLANPLAAWNPTTNPYRTIDRMPVGVVVFNGVDMTSSVVARGAMPQSVASCQRGSQDSTVNQLWAQGMTSATIAQTPSSTDTSNAYQHVFNYWLQHSLGYLNTNYGAAYGTAANAQSTAYQGTGGSNPAPMAPVNGPTLSPYVGAPSGGPFPWLTWNNRPFVGPLELMLVPKSRSSRLSIDFAAGFPLPATMPPGAGMYAPSGAPVPPAPGSGHLFDFFQVPGNAGGSIPPAAHLYRIFDFVQVPSRFVGTETQLNPQSCVGSPVTNAALFNEQAMYSLFHPPFNKVSNYHDPGRVNINTIPSDTPAGNSSVVWNAIVGQTTQLPFGMTNFLNQNAPSQAANGWRWQNVAQSRQGSTVAYPNIPTAYFGNPFRSASGAAYLMPNTPNLASITGNDIDVTLMRPSGVPGSFSDQPLFLDVSSNSWENTSRNAYFRFETLQRLSNLLTTRSNVYAIWITVGYFEVMPWTGNPQFDLAHPDGYQLGQELYSDTGEIRRHRAFYIFDRSIPVGFEPGHDHNIDRATLIKRFIE